MLEYLNEYATGKHQETQTSTGQPYNMRQYLQY